MIQPPQIHHQMIHLPALLLPDPAFPLCEPVPLLFPAKLTELINNCNPTTVRKPHVRAINAPKTKKEFSLLMESTLPANVTWAMMAPSGWDKPPKINVIPRAFHLEFKERYKGNVIVKPSMTLWMAKERKIERPNFGSASDVMYVMKPSGNLCNVKARQVCNPMENNFEIGVLTLCWWSP
ncbi:hypothetical protein WICPIJ_003630 [Wickerhamomyces pijperi]|uniref:Uncharacterized protein n=1 Tax=Wickerhamomyces pijperi TaxID=599730 RepID=A0A9P8Q9A4_WICPI|nr:hypothetical protein WICPIJ_003630 [Wickerhamomyces pijperi]